MAFNRHQILVNHYTKEIAAANWEAIKDSALNNCRTDQESENIIASYYCGSVFSVMPSGKFYMPWTSNQTRHDEQKDQAYWEALESVAEAQGFFVSSESEDIHLEKIVDYDSVKGWITSEDMESAEDLLFT